MSQPPGRDNSSAVSALAEYATSCMVRVRRGEGVESRAPDPTRRKRRHLGLSAVLRQTANLNYNFGFSFADGPISEYCLQGDFEVFRIGPPRELIGLLPAGTCLSDDDTTMIPSL